MSFDANGFLLPEMGGWAQTQDELRDWLALARDTNTAAMSVLYGVGPPKGSNAKLLASVFFGRALQSYQGAVLLAERGMVADARTLVRSCLESAIAIAGLAHDAAFVEDLVDSYERHRWGMGNALLNSPGSLTELGEEGAKEVRGALAEIAAEYGGKPPTINWEEVATRVGMSQLYLSVYRRASSDGAHATIESIARHAVVDDQFEIERLVFEPSSRDLASSLSGLVSAMLCAIEALAGIYDAEDLRSKALEHADRWRKLEAELQRLSDTG